MNERLADVTAFVAAVEAGGFSAAAQRLNLSRSAVGKRVAQLEGRLGVRLMHRTTRSVSLTDDGAAFYERCAQVLGELQAAEAAVQQGRAQPVGRIRLSAPVLLGRRCVAPVVSALARLYPGLELEVMFTDRPVDLVEEGFDLVIRNGNLPLRSPLMSRRIAHQRMGVFAAPTYLEKRSAPSSLTELADHEAVIYSRTGRPRSWLFPRANGAPHEIEMRSRLRFDDLEALMDAACDGMGLAWLPCWLARERVQDGRLVRLLADIPSMVFDSHAVWPHAPHLPSRVRVTIDALAQRLPALMADPGPADAACSRSSDP